MVSSSVCVTCDGATRSALKSYVAIKESIQAQSLQLPILERCQLGGAVAGGEFWRVGESVWL